jgi:Right handed beta helix region
MNTVWKLCGIITFFVATITNGADIYVSPTGNDAASGTLAAPLATIAAARDKADQLKTGNTPVTVYLRGGTYYLDTTVVFGPSNTGTATAPIVYKNYGSEKPVISGGIKLSDTTKWTVSSGQIMVTTIAPNLKVDQLFLNGKRQVLARFPNFDSTKILDGYDPNCTSPTRVATWKNPGEGPGYIRALHPKMWGGNSYTITGKNSNNFLDTVWAGDNNVSTMHPTYRMVENIFEELDAPGEWFYRKATGQLYFYPPAGTNLATAKIELASQDELIRILGTSSTGVVQYLTFDGLTFTHTYRTLFSKPYYSLLRSDWTIAHTGCLYITNSENILVNNCTFDQIGGNGIFMYGYNRHNVVYNNVFVDAGASCVCLIGDTISVRCPLTFSGGTCTDRTPGPRSPDYPAFIVVDNNLMNHFGRFEKQTAGVAIGISECDTVRHNTVHDCPRAGMSVNSNCFGGHDISFNWIYNTVLETDDHGPFNAWGRDRNAYFKDDTTMANVDAWKTTVIRNNRFEEYRGKLGIDLDDNSSNYLQDKNLVLGGGLKFMMNRNNTYINNILSRTARLHIFGFWWGNNAYVARNIFDDSQPYSDFQITPDTLKRNTKLIDSNFISSTSSQVCGLNQCYSWAQWHTAGLDVHSVQGMPTYADTAKVFPNNYAPRGDFSITSPAALALGFKNFPMDSFGVMPVTGTHVIQNPNVKNAFEHDNKPFDVHFSARKLFISHEGSYQVAITSALGRTVKAYSGKGLSIISFGTKTMGSGVFFVVVHSQNGMITRKLFVN